jgi:hypothetical protein
MLVISVPFWKLPVQAQTATFGNTRVGTYANHLSFNKDASRFVLTENGTIQSITVYFSNANFYAKAAIYTDSNGSPNQLVTQSNSERIRQTGWHTFTIPQTPLTPGYYWLTAVCSRTRAQGRMSITSTANQHALKTASYSTEFTAKFGAPNKYNSYSTSIYATYISTATQQPPAANIKIYWDQGCTNATSTVNWGNLSPGSTTNMTIYVRNEGTTPLTLTKQLTNWNPTNASAYITIAWNYANQTLNAGSTTKMTLTISVSPNATAINNFTFDIKIIGTG